jgi:hypothetical protein
VSARRAAVVGLALATLVPTACGGRDAPLATGERFRLEPVVQFTSTIGDGALESIPLLTPRIGAGYHVVTTPWGAGEKLPRLFDGAGNYRRTLGREGAGPQEFRAAEMVYATGDTAMIFDLGARRMTFFAPPDSFLRTVPWQFRPYSLLELADGTFVLTTGDFSAGPAMLHVARDGTLLREFGEYAEPQETRHRVFAPAADGGFWSARSSRRLEVQKWRAPGDLEATIPLSASWYPPYTTLTRASPTEPPSPAVMAIWADDAGMLWIVGMVAGERWFEGLGDPRPVGDGRSYVPVTDPDKVYDTIIEQWDPVSRTRRWSERLDRFYGLQPGPWMMGVTSESMLGVQTAEVLRVVPR